MSKNKARSIERKLTSVKKNVADAWEKFEYPNLFGGGPITDPQGRIVSLEITAFGHVAKFFEEDDVQNRLREAIRKNNLEFSGFNEAEVDVNIKKSVDLKPPLPSKPIFIMKSYELQSYLSTLIRYINKLNGDEVPNGLTWGLNKDVPPPSGWRNELLDFSKYGVGGPEIKFGGHGKLPPMIKDIILHYFYLLEVNPNDALNILEDYEDRPVDNLSFIPPPPDFVIPAWATPCSGESTVASEYEHEGSETEDIVPEETRERIVLRLKVPHQASSSPAKKRYRSPSISPEEGSPQASSTMRSPLILRLSQQRNLSKPAKKSARLSTTLGMICGFCSDPVTKLDIKSKNNLVQCGNHRVHKYCQQDCIEAHGDLL